MLAGEPNERAAVWLRLIADRLGLAAQDLLSYGHAAGVVLRLPREPWTARTHVDRRRPVGHLEEGLAAAASRPDR